MKKLLFVFAVVLLASCGAGENGYASFAEAKNLYMKGDSVGALAVLEKLEKENRNFLLPYVLDGRINFFLGNYAEAERKLEYVLEKNPLDFEGVRWLSAVLIRKKEFEKGEALLERSLEKYPEEPRLLLMYAYIEGQLGKYGRAAEAYGRLFLFEEELATAHFDFALILGKSAMRERYRAELERAALLAGENHELSAAIRKLYE